MPAIVSADGSRTTNYIRSGERGMPKLVLIHAIGLDASYWQPQFDWLAQDFDVIAYDIVGHGKSSPLVQEVDFRSLVSDLDRLIEETGGQSAHLVGLSLGGMIAQHAAIWMPNRVRSLVLIDTAATLPKTGREAILKRAETCRASGMPGLLDQTIARWFTPEFAAAHPEVIARVSETLLNDDVETHAKFWDLIATLDMAPRLAEVPCPALVLVGEKDPTTPAAMAQLIADAIPHSRLEILPGLSHMVPLEAPELTNNLISAFLISAERRLTSLPDTISTGR